MKSKKRIVVLKKAKDFNERKDAGCGLAFLVVKIPVKAC